MEPSLELVRATIAIALVAGIVAQLVAERLSVPAIVPLLAFGALLGPEALGLVHPDSLGIGLEVLVRVAVAVILFEGGLNLEWAQLRSQGRVIIRLVTVGALVTLAGATLAAMALLPLGGWESLLLGSLVIVTGPTVIGPLLKRVRVVRRVAFILESEGVLIDPIGSILAFLVLELVVSQDLALVPALGAMVARLAVGAAVGAAAALAIARILTLRWITDPELASLTVLTTAVTVFMLANSIVSESGLVAAVVAGIVLGNVPFPGRRDVGRFKGILTTLAISLLFVLLSADIRWSVLGEVGWGGLAWVAALMFVVRPLNVFVSTLGTEVTFRDRLFLASISPRGIVAASVVSIVAILLQGRGIEGGELLQALVFLTIATTVVVQGLTAGACSRWLGVSADSYGVIVVGAGPTGRALGRLLQDHGRPVGLIDSNAQQCERAKTEGLAVLTGNCLEPENLAAVGILAADALVAVTGNSEVNYLVAQLARDEFRVPRAMALETEGSQPVDVETRESRRIERAFAVRAPDELDFRFRRQPPLWSARAKLARATKLVDLALSQGLPLVLVHGGRAEVCSDSSVVHPGDVVVCLDEPVGEWVENVAPYVSPQGESADRTTT